MSNNPNLSKLNRYPILQDPRQFVPPSGQTFTTLRDLRAGKYHNVWKQDDHDKWIQCVSTEPKVGRVVDDMRKLVSIECVLI